jgi:hypothetical protein
MAEHLDGGYWLGWRTMKHGDDYGPYSFWIHFFCGLVVGGAFGAVIGYQFFNSARCIAVTAFVVGGSMAWAAGRWGDRAWEEAMSLVFWWFMY